MRSERGNTVEEPAVITSPVTASGAYIAIGSSITASVGASVEASVGTTVATGACVAEPPHAAITRLNTAKTKTNERAILDISISPIIFISKEIITMHS